MAKYYGVERSSEYLAHYGVKGMKWGVRKARERGNEKALARHYKRAQKKLQKLSDRADVSKQQKAYATNKKMAKIGARVGLAGVGMTVGGTTAGKLFQKAAYGTLNKKVAHDKRYNEYMNHMTEAHEKRFLRNHNRLLAQKAPDHVHDTLAENAINNYNKMADKAYSQHQVTNGKLQNQLDRQSKGYRTSYSVGRVGLAMTGAGLGMGTVHAIKAAKAKKRMSAEGHAKAVAERDAWKREMDKAFKGKLPAQRKKKPRKYFTKQDFKQAAKTAGLGMIMGPAAANMYMTSKKAANEIPANNNRHGKKRRR